MEGRKEERKEGRKRVENLGVGKEANGKIVIRERARVTNRRTERIARGSEHRTRTRTAMRATETCFQVWWSRRRPHFCCITENATATVIPFWHYLYSSGSLDVTQERKLSCMAA